MKDFRKLYADSIYQTTHLLKKAVMIPIRYDEDGNQEEVIHAYNPFMRGVMEFDDYNYAYHNQYVLVEDPKFAEVDKEKGAGADSIRSAVIPPATATPGDRMGATEFSQKNINSSVTEEYEHNLVSIEPSEMELEKAEQARQEALAQEEAAKEKARKDADKMRRKSSKNAALGQTEDDEDKDKLEGEAGEDSKKGSDKDEAEDDDDEGDEFNYRVYYRKEEIMMASQMQARDQFEELVNMRHNTVAENKESQPANKFNILDFTPRAKSPNLSMSKKKISRSGLQGSRKRGAIIGFEDDDDDQNFDEYVADL